MRTIIVLLALALAAPWARAAGYTDETWDDPGQGNNKWAYWDLEYGTSPHNHHPMDWFGGGGSGGTGYVSAPLEELDIAIAHTVSSYWPAYPGEKMETEGFPYIDLTIPGAAVSVEIKGGHNPLGPPVDLGGGQVRLFIGYYDTHDTPTEDDDEQAFFCTKGTFDVGDNLWEETTVALGGDDDWMLVVREEVGKVTMPTDLYDGPQQWGFAIFPVPLGSFPSGGTLGFDEFHVVPEPALATLLFAAFIPVLRRRRRDPV